mgnify:CR=1 FL=1
MIKINGLFIFESTRGNLLRSSNLHNYLSLGLSQKPLKFFKENVSSAKLGLGLSEEITTPGK